MNLRKVLCRVLIPLFIAISVFSLGTDKFSFISDGFFGIVDIGRNSFGINSDGDLYGYTLYQSDESLELYISNTGAVAIKNTISRNVYMSNPGDNPEYNGLVTGELCDEVIISYAVSGVLYSMGSAENEVTREVKLNNGNDKGADVHYVFPITSNSNLKLSVHYYLKNGTLVADIIDIEYPENPDVVTASVTLLKGLGGIKRTNTAYFLLPDGNGGKMSLSEPYKESSLKLSVYGTDKATYPLLSESAVTVIPFFSKADIASEGMFAFIANGESTADIIARRNGIDELSYIYPVFNLTSSYEKEIGGQAYKVYRNETYQDKITVIYNFLSADESTVENIAVTCREELLKSGYLSFTGRNEGEMSSVTFYIDGSEVSYKKALDIITYAKENGIGKMSVIYTNCLDGLKTTGLPGRKRSLTKLSEYCEKSGISLYLEYDITEDSVGSTVSNILGHRLVFKTTDTFDKVIDNVFIENEKYLDNLYLPYFGDVLYSQYCGKSVQQRETVKNDISDFLGKFSAEHSIAVDAGNAYTLKNIDLILNFKREKTLIADGYDFVLFNALVLHGEVDYVLPPVTVVGKITSQLDWALECGVMPSFNLTDKNYKEEIKEISEYYSKYISIISKIKNKNMISNTQSGTDINISVFDDDCKLYINYSSSERTVSDVTLAPGEILLVN